MDKDLDRDQEPPSPRLLTISHDPHLDPQAPVVKRLAMRAVVPRASTLLLLRSRTGAYKFPGGGAGTGEDVFAALARELREECGVTDLRVGRHFITAVERSCAQEAGRVFEMTSRYYWCSTVEGALRVPQRLEAYEDDLGLTPVWVAPEAAIAGNRSLSATSAAVLPWLVRDTHVLRAVARSWR